MISRHNYYERDEIEFLQTHIYEANKEKGFWEDNRSDYEVCSLIISEASEALEADRKGRHFLTANKKITDIDLKDDSEFIVIFKENVKDTFEDEIADVAIRTFDFMGRLKSLQPELDFSLRSPQLTLAYDVCNYLPELAVYDFFERGYFKDLKPAESLLLVSAIAVKVGMDDRWGVEKKEYIENQYKGLILMLDILCNINDYIKDHVRLKLRYNATRPYKHGKNY